jgi:hypothetical protein
MKRATKFLFTMLVLILLIIAPVYGQDTSDETPDGGWVDIQPADDLDAIASVPETDGEPVPDVIIVDEVTPVDETVTLTRTELETLLEDAKTQVAPIPDIVIYGLLLLAGMYVLRGAIDRLSKSVPTEAIPLVESFGRTAHDLATKLIEKKLADAEQDDNMWNDEIWRSIYMLHKGTHTDPSRHNPQG